MSKVEIPVVVTVFDRLETLNVLLDSLEKYTFTCLIFSSDGPRDDSDTKKIEDVRAAIDSRELRCDELIKVYNENNLGIYKNAEKAINLAIHRGEAVLLLEDDVIPKDGFFNFLNAAIDYGGADSRIAAYCGFNPVGATPAFYAPFHRSKGARFWGICIKKRHWIEFQNQADVSERTILQSLSIAFQRPGVLSKLLGIKVQLSHRKDPMLDLHFGEFMLKKKYFSLVSSKSLIENIGHGEMATHTKKMPNIRLKKWPSPFFVSSRVPKRVIKRTEILYGYLVLIWWLKQKLISN